MKKKYELNINNKTYKIKASPNDQLLKILRDTLKLTGTKNGCNKGLCGSCTILVNSKAVRACVYTVEKSIGKLIETIEGLADKSELHPLQKAFIDYGAVQCGFCSPGMLMSAKSLLNKNKNPDREAIIKAIKPNLCRCTGYWPIIYAIEAVTLGKYNEK